MSIIQPLKYQRPFLKWAGGKFRLLPKILHHLPQGKKLIEPFVGSGVVFLNADYDRYLLADINPDLINLFKDLKRGKGRFIDYCSTFFTEANNTEKKFYELREHFNKLKPGEERSALFLYFNRHGYNGLCRYNRSGGFNVPFGRYKRPYFPESELEFFAKKSQRAEFRCQSFRASFNGSRQGDVIYCDPPYLPQSLTANFTDYTKQGFSYDQQVELGYLAERARKKGVITTISNHDTIVARDIYEKADKVTYFDVQRFISCDGNNRTKAKELLAIYG
ncbi:Dam family site-specific DNA-(adenine-N6)-methyltransferase [Kangiella sediminilitoris]|uniref:Site-specific DNA-methyltransferase (adenine-specific) n=1 Tax=Kangiella sediminilitoris TaxID=1144748 RepID=A0A1B3B8Q5_9GAMM|nr:Dam family site-specific DNA-(adenine-N6)-methyltransferase [Kangiella sediminilitoris]AOE49189.1 DNA adenine methylase [Kangiella sediminilitoris]